MVQGFRFCHETNTLAIITVVLDDEILSSFKLQISGVLYIIASRELSYFDYHMKVNFDRRGCFTKYVNSLSPINHYQISFMNLIIRITFLVSLFACSILASQAESHRVKMLKHELVKAGNQEKQCELLLNIADEMRGSKPDSALRYYLRVEAFLQKMKHGVLRKTFEIRCLLGRTSINTIQGKFDESWKLDSMALKMARDIKSADLEAQALMSKGSIYYHQSDFDKAQQINQQALTLARKGGNPKTEGKILTNIGTIEFMFGNVEKADSLFRIPVEIARRHHDDDLLAASLINLGQLNLYRGDYSASEESYLKAVAVYKRINGIDGLALSYQNLSNIYLMHNDFAKAIEHNLLAEKYFTIIGDPLGIGTANNNLGECYTHQGNYEMGLMYFLKGLKQRRSTSNQKDIGSSLLSLGHLHSRLLNVALAKKYYREAGSCYQKIGYSYGIANAYDAIANLFLDEGNLDSSLYYNEKAAILFEQLQSYVNLASSWLDIGTIHLQRNELAEAERFYMKGLKIKEESGDSISLVQALSLLSSLYLEKARQTAVSSSGYKANLNLATDYALKAYRISVSGKNYPAIMDATVKLTAIYEEKGEPAMALHYAKIRMEVADTLGKVQRADALAEAEIKWKTEQKQTEINRLLVEKSLQQQLLSQTLRSSARLQIIIGALLLVAVLLTTMFFMFLKSRKRKKEIEYQLHLNEVTRLKMQNINNRLSPHFLFNMLGSVAHAENHDAGYGRDRITQIAHLLRKSLESTEKVAISLRDELAMVEMYLQLQSSRIEGGIQFELVVDDTLPPGVMVPVMCVQIPAENAIKHGLLPLDGERRLTIRCKHVKSHVEIEIEDNGVGRQYAQGRTAGTGTGLKSLLQTIHLLNRRNKEQVVFSIDDAAIQGTMVRLIIPLQYDYTL